MKNLTIAGNIGKDAEVRKTQDGTAVTGFSVAVEDRGGREKQTLWFDCSIWGQRGEKLAQYLTKGSKVTVSGDFGTREHNGKTYLTLRVNDVALQGAPQRSDEGMYSDRGPAPADDLDGDSIPF